MKTRNLNIANFLTLLRILLVPVFFMLCFYTYDSDAVEVSRLDRALAISVFFILVLTDFADGYIARKRRIITPLGAFLDPLADKIFVTTSFILLAAFDQIPVWLTIIVVTKDLLMLLGWGVLFILGISQTVHPSLMGKLCAVLQYTVICAVLIQLPDFLLKGFLFPATAILTAVAFVGYALDAFEKANQRSHN